MSRTRRCVPSGLIGVSTQALTWIGLYGEVRSEYWDNKKLMWAQGRDGCYHRQATYYIKTDGQSTREGWHESDNKPWCKRFTNHKVRRAVRQWLQKEVVRD